MHGKLPCPSLYYFFRNVIDLHQILFSCKKYIISGGELKTLSASGLDGEKAHGKKGGEDERPRSVDRSVRVQASGLCCYNGRAEACYAVQTGRDACACPSIWRREDFRGAGVYVLA